MKNIKKYIAFSLLVFLTISCEQELLNPSNDPCDGTDPSIICPPPPIEDCPAGASQGSADFSKFVAIGNSYVAGFQAGALFNEGQSNSIPKILASKFVCVGGTATLNQPDINSANGYNIQSSVPGVITLGRMILFDPDGSGSRTAAPYPAGFPGSAVTCPSAVTTPPLPAPYNTADLPTAFAGDKAALNNFGVPLIYLGQALIPDTGNPASPYYNPLWARFASQPGVKSILQDALGAAGSFYLIWLGFDDVLLYAATGADGTYPMTSDVAFSSQFSTLITSMLGANPNFKGVVGNIPNFSSLPYFYTVTWNTIKLDAATADALKPLADGYNGALQALKTNGIISEDELNKRLISYKAFVQTDPSTLNGVLLTDETLTDLSPYLPDALDHMARARQATATDLIPLAAGAVLGTCFGGSPAAISGVSYPVADKYAIIPSETTEILTRTAAFNAAISTAVAGSADRLALADVNKVYADFVTAKAAVVNGVTITPSFAPPTGAFSEDGLHPNSRGYVFTANVFIDAINTKFGASVPKANPGSFSATGLPINP